jgi:tetratricopeptide (TPR) repeat protein
MHARQFTEAVGLYEQAVCLVPESARGFYGLGMAAAASGDYTRAIQSFQEADRLQPTTAMPLVMQVRVNFSRGDMEALKGNLRDVALRFPTDAEAHGTLAKFLGEHDLLILALAEALRSTSASGHNSASTLQLAGLENTAGAYDDAIRNALLVEKDSAVPDPLRAVAAGIAGLSYESLGKTDLALKYLKESIVLDQTRENSYLALADLLDQKQRYADATELLKEARIRIPDSEPILLALGRDLVRTENYHDGIAALQQVLQKSPDEIEAYMGLADAYRKTGDSRREVAALRALASRKPDYPMIHLLIARALLDMQPLDLPGTTHELELAEKESPADPDAFYLRGKMYATMGRYADAVAPLRHSIELASRSDAIDPGPNYQLAKVYQKLGQPELAREQFEQIKYLESIKQKAAVR